MHKFIATLGFCIGTLAIMSFSNADANNTPEALEVGGPKITCPQGDHYKCVEKGGVVYYKGNGDVIIEL